MPNRSSIGATLSPQRSALFYWLPPLIWMSVIFGFSTDTFSGENTGSLLYTILHYFWPSLTPEQFQPLHFLVRKASHFTEYGILALLLFRAFRGNSRDRWRWSWALWTWLLVALYALSDEWHQSFSANRTASLYDSLIDTLGGTTALLVWWWFTRRKQTRSVAG